MDNNKQSTLLDGYWVIGTNKWNADLYTQEESEKYAETLVECYNCINCRSCIGCSGCIGCSDCIGCRSCSFCSSCSSCIGCRSCSSCSDCRYCIGCSDCSFCSSCRYCNSCIDCSDCRSCSDCRYCIGCSDFKTNPQRIISPILGSRNSQTTYYWNDENEQIICGCFKGTLEEFEAKIKETHSDNQHAQNYFKWIEKVKIYRQ